MEDTLPRATDANASAKPKPRVRATKPEVVTPGIHIELVPLSKLMAWPGNPKEHDLEGLGESFERFGFVDPIIFDERSKKIVAGHGRREKLLAWKDSGHPPPDRIVVRGKEWLVPVLRGVGFRNAHEAEAYVLGNNHLVIKGGYNATALVTMLERHADDASGIGWKPDEIRELVAKAAKAAQGAYEDATVATNEDSGPADYDNNMHTCPKCGSRVACIE